MRAANRRVTLSSKNVLSLCALLSAGRFASFPAPGDVKKHLLPQLEDGEERKPSSTEASEAAAPKPAALDNKDYWMPVRASCSYLRRGLHCGWKRG